jgi:hypothetical protein
MPKELLQLHQLPNQEEEQHTMPITNQLLITDFLPLMIHL